MEHAQLASNPFALMLDPAAVVMAMEKSERLSRLHSRICRPLDKIVGAPAAEDAAEVAEVAEADDMIIGGFAITMS